MNRLLPIGPIISSIFKRPAVLVQRKDGRVEQLTPGELRQRGIDPNNDDDWLGKILEKVKDFFCDLWDQLNNGRI